MAAAPVTAPSDHHASTRSTPAHTPLRPRKIKKYGWIPDIPDHRDFLYAAPTPFQTNLPTSVDLSPQCPPVYDQGQLGSCTANAIAAAIEFDQMKQKQPQPFVPSRLFIYYNERVIEGDPGQDGGAQIRDGIKSVSAVGAPPEQDWDYDITKFADKPPQAAYDDAKQHLVTLYQRMIQESGTLRGCLASGYPFVFGFTCYESFESAEVAQTGILPMPKSGEHTVGGHAVLCVGYDDDKQMFRVRNSWSDKWGQKGYFEMPYAYLTNHRLASDLWTIRSVQ